MGFTATTKTPPSYDVLMEKLRSFRNQVYRRQLIQVDEALLPLIETMERDVPKLFQHPRWSTAIQRAHDAAACIWLAIAVSHAENHEFLYQISHHLEISDQDLFILGASWGNAAFFEYLVTRFKHSGQLHELMFVSVSESFHAAVQYGHVAVVDLLMRVAPDQIKTMMADRNYHAFIKAATEGHIDVLKFFMQVAPAEAQAMLVAKNFMAFHNAAAHGQSHVVEYLLSFPVVFSYADLHDGKYDRYIDAYIEKKLVDLHVAQTAFVPPVPNAVFDIADPEEVKLCFCILRSLIRFNTATARETIPFLLTIPAVRRAVTLDSNNELLLLARNCSNRGAATLLLDIPEVRKLAVRNNYYDKCGSGLNLRELVTEDSLFRQMFSGIKAKLGRATDGASPAEGAAPAAARADSQAAANTIPQVSPATEAVKAPGFFSRRSRRPAVAQATAEDMESLLEASEASEALESGKLSM